MSDLLQRIATLEETVRRLSLRAQHTIKNGRQVEASNETGVVQGIRLKHNSRDTRDVASLQMYGFASAPIAGADHVTVQIAGDSSNGFIIASNDQRFRPQNLNPGASQMHDMNGDYMMLDNLNVTIFTAGTVTVMAPTVHFTGNVVVDGDVKAGAVSLRTHNHGGVQGGTGTTSIPIGGP
jgi:phage gp45-like